MKERKAVAVVDAMGLFCPLPIIKTEKKMRALGSGKVVKVLSDDPTFPRDMTDWCRRTGNKLLAVKGKGGAFQAYVKKRG